MPAEVQVAAAAGRLSGLFPAPPAGGVVLGSGLGDLPRLLGAGEGIPYASLPGFPTPAVPGHAGAVHALATPAGPVALLSGRYHGYEPEEREAVGLPVALLAALGARRVVLTCAAGAVDPTMSAGDLLVVSDHLNLLGWNPLQEIPAARRRPRFLDLSDCYDAAMTDAIAAAARGRDVPYRRGVLAAVPGPTYETPAEVRMLERLGADAVTMSTVPEAILARYLGLSVAAIAVISNRAPRPEEFDEPRIRHEAVLRNVAAATGGLAGFFGAVASLAAAGAAPPPESGSGDGAREKRAAPGR